MKKDKLDVQDVRSSLPTPSEGEMYVYYVLSDATYFGKTKWHCTPDCPHLTNWQPAGHRVLRESGWKGPKLVYRDVDSKPTKPEPWNCKTCWKNFKYVP